MQQASVQHGAAAVPLDFAALREACSESDLAVAMEVQPAEALACIAAALYQVSFSRSPFTMGRAVALARPSYAGCVVEASILVAARCHPMPGRIASWHQKYKQTAGVWQAQQCSSGCSTPCKTTHHIC